MRCRPIVSWAKPWRLGRRGPLRTVTECPVYRTVCCPTAGFLPGGGTIRRNRLRMGGKTIMNRRNGSAPSPPNGLAENMGKLAHDIVSLTELQFELFRSDCREGLKRMLVPIAMLLVAGTVAVGTVPIALTLIAELLTQAGGLSRAAAVSIAALSGFIVAVAIGVAGWCSLRGVVRVLERSGEEFARNMIWIKHALKQSAPIESQQTQDR